MPTSFPVRGAWVLAAGAQGRPRCLECDAPSTIACQKCWELVPKDPSSLSLPRQFCSAFHTAVSGAKPQGSLNPITRSPAHCVVLVFLLCVSLSHWLACSLFLLGSIPITQEEAPEREGKAGVQRSAAFLSRDAAEGGNSLCCRC